MREFPSFDEMVLNVSEGYERGDKIPSTDLLDQAQRSAHSGDGITTLMLVMAHQFAGSDEDRRKALNAFAIYQRVVAQDIYSQSQKSQPADRISNRQIESLVEVTGRLNLAYILDLIGRDSRPQS